MAVIQDITNAIRRLNCKLEKWPRPLKDFLGSFHQLVLTGVGVGLSAIAWSHSFPQGADGAAVCYRLLAATPFGIAAVTSPDEITNKSNQLTLTAIYMLFFMICTGVLLNNVPYNSHRHFSR